jgi:branched-chain amino acid aminotransferase
MGIGAAVSAATVLDGDPGRMIPFGANSMQHGTAVFEGIRCYATAGGAHLFRLDDHLTRLLASARAMGIPHGYDLDELRDRVLMATAAAGLTDSYVRPVLYTPHCRLGVDLRAFEFTFGVEVWPAVDEQRPGTRGLRLMLSPWHRPGRTSFPVGTKATGLYAFSAVARTHAAASGFDDAVQLDPDTGRVAESTISNVFLVRAGTVLTPWLEDSLCPGITRRSVLELAQGMGIEVVEGPVTVADLHAADEVFLTGTALGLAPAGSFDDTTYGPERPVFTALDEAYRAAVRGLDAAPAGWLTPVPDPIVSRIDRGES